jgi:hypothetical protein
MKVPFKKILIFFSFLIIVFLIAYAIYYFFFRPAPPPAGYLPTAPMAVMPGGLPEIINENLNRQLKEEGLKGLPSIERVPKGEIVSEKARGGYTKVNMKLNYGQSPHIRLDGSLAYYDSNDGRFYKLNPDGSRTLFTSKKFYNVSGITWSDDANKAILEYPDGSNIIYDFLLNKQYTLPKEMQDFDIAKNNQLIAAEVIAEREESNWIVTSNPDGTNIKFIERIGNKARDVDVNISPNNQVVALYRENIDANSQQILLIGQQNENFKGIITNGRGFESQWTANGNQLLYSVYQANNGFKPTLWLVNASGEQIGTSNTNLGLETWANKCTVASQNAVAYCAVPESLPYGSGWYPELAEDSPDNFYKIDLNTGRVTLLAKPVGERSYYSASSVFLSPDEQTLYFQDNTGGIYSVGL